MKNLIKLITLTLIVFLLNLQTTTAQCHIDDWTALKALYESTDGDNWTNRTGWDWMIDNRNSPPVSCNLDELHRVFLNQNGRVYYLELSFNQLNGSIPPELGNLSNLLELYLSNNSLAGEIPAELGSLVNLESLSLSRNLLSGTIPFEFENLINLNHLNLSSNRLEGSIPPELGSLNNLRVLMLNINELIESIPPQLGNLTNLTRLFLGGNQLSGNIPSNLGNLINLEWLNLGTNQLNGSIPTQLSNLVNLYELDLYFNDLSGNIPPELGNLTNLQALRLHNNQLSGAIPSELDDLINLRFLLLNNNNLNNSIPPELGNLINLRYLLLNNNNLSNSIPPELGNLSELTRLGLFNNQLNGDIPPELGNLSKLEKLELSFNDFNGTIPSQIGSLGNLTHLYIDSNELTGNIPSELGSLSNLEFLNLSSNQLNGNIPTQIGDLSNLFHLVLSENNLIGNIPSQFKNMSNLILLEINNNDLTGCYDNDLFILCNQLIHGNFNGNSDINNGNNFYTSWESFCSSNGQEGVCIDLSPPTTSNVWPGDVNNDGIVNNADRSIHYLFFNESGTPRTQQGISWQAYPALDWGTTQPNGNDIKHFDCDGNGFINIVDKNAIILNWGETHNEGFNNPDIPNSIGFALFGTDYQIYLRPTNQVSDNPLIMDVVLESIDGNNLNLFGGYFTIDYNNINANIANAVFDLNNSWLGFPDIDLMGDYKNFPNTKKIEIAFSKTNGIASVGNGIIGQVTFQIDHSNFSLDPNNPQIVNFTVNQIGAHDTEGNILPIEDQQYSVNIGNSTCSNNLTINQNTPFQNLYNSANTISTDSLVIIGQNQQVEYRANRITLTEGFSAKAGADFKVRSSGCN